MMEHFSKFVDAPKTERVKVSNVIYTFDIETTSLFRFPDGWGVFRPDLTAEEYNGLEKCSVPYIWQFSVEADEKCNVYYGRDFRDVEKIFLQIEDKSMRKIVWIFNAGFEFQFLRDIFDHYTVTDMCCRQSRKPIRWRIKEWNIEFRCAYMLTGLKLETAAKQYTTLEKRTGDLDYNVVRGINTYLDDTELGYCEWDCRTLHAIIEHYRAEYGGKLDKIPLTQTGEVRKELRSRVDWGYIKRIQKQVPKSVHIMRLLMRASAGGLTHACYLYAGKIMERIASGDMASAYPAVMLCYRFPSSRWIKTTPDGAEGSDREHWASLYHVIIKGVQSKYFNNYILASKCVAASGLYVDNGRVISADVIEAVWCEVDWDIVKECYEIDSIEYVECYINRKDYLPEELRRYILDLYGQKTRLKNIESMEMIYRKSKTRINSLFGCAMTNVVKGSADYKAGEWTTQGPTDEFIGEKLEEQRKSRTNCFAFQWGLYVTAYCRRRTWQMVTALDPKIVGIDKGVIYYDTDSCKAPVSPEFYAAMEKNNNEYMDRLKTMCAVEGFDISDAAPLDPDGVAHPIGLWENEAKKDDYSYDEFCTLGAKRYAHRDHHNGQLEITVSGVRSSTGKNALHDDIRNFKGDMTFDYDQCGKLTSYYIDNMEPITFTDCQGNVTISTQQHGIVLQPTTYHMGIDDVYEALWEEDIIKEGRK